MAPHARPPLPPEPGPDVSVILREFAARDERSVADLAALLDSATASSVRRSAAQLLAEMGTPSAVAALLHAIANAPAGEPAADLLAALDSLTNPEAAPALSAFLLRTSDPAVLAPVRDALARLADAPGVLEIVTALHEGASERWQQANLVGALLNVRSPAAVPVLREVLLRDSNPTLQGQAALVLGYIGGPESADALATALASSRSSAFTAAVSESLALLRARARQNPSQSDDPP
jgi:HEAT repeat protein